MECKEQNRVIQLEKAKVSREDRWCRAGFRKDSVPANEVELAVFVYGSDCPGKELLADAMIRKKLYTLVGPQTLFQPLVKPVGIYHGCCSRVGTRNCRAIKGMFNRDLASSM